MKLFQPKIYGVKVRTKSGWNTYWYGHDRDKRDRMHNEFSKKDGVLAVRNVEMKP